MTKQERKKLNKVGGELRALAPKFGHIQFNFKDGRYSHFNRLETGKPEKRKENQDE